MANNLIHHSPPFLLMHYSHPYFLPTTKISSLAFVACSYSCVYSSSRKIRSPLYSSASHTSSADASSSEQHSLSDGLIARVSSAKDSNEVLAMLEEASGSPSGSVTVPACSSIITAALDQRNFDLAFSIFNSMRSFSEQDANQNGLIIRRWTWPKMDAGVYTSFVLGLANQLKVSDALLMVSYVSRLGASPGEEVPFGKVVRCPKCSVAVAVAQPQHGIQIASCAQCRCKYELVSGNIVSINSEAIRMDLPAWKRVSRLLQLTKEKIPASLHSIVVQTPSGVARTHKFCTETADLPAQEAERVTIASAAPSSAKRAVGPLRLTPKPPDVQSSEPMSLTNHKDGRESLLLRAPSKDEGLSLLNPSVLLPLVAVVATSDAASAIIDPNLPRLLGAAAIASLGVGVVLNSLVLPQLSLLPKESVETVGIKQGLLSQYDVLQDRIRKLKDATEKEVWMLARMCQLENKITAVGEPSYSARKVRIKKVKEGLEKSIRGRIELIDSYARISSMIEIEVEMDYDVVIAEAVTTSEAIAEQIQQVMDLEELEETWRIQAQANDQAETLLSQTI